MNILSLCQTWQLGQWPKASNYGAVGALQLHVLSCTTKRANKVKGGVKYKTRLNPDFKGKIHNNLVKNIYKIN